MKTQTAIRFRIFVLVAVLTLGLTPIPAQALTQQDWMVALVDALGRSYGLPDTPTPEDYINILSGKRNLHFEAEEVSSPDDSVSKMALPNFGTFSGEGWLLGISRPTDVHLNIVVPLGGNYLIAVTLRSPGHTLQAGGQTFEVDGDADKFANVEVGEVSLPAGPTSIVLTLPPGGAVDAISLTAPDLAPITPEQGWQPESPLTWDVLALTSVQSLHLEGELPPAAEPLQSMEAEDIKDFGAARLVEDSHLGAPSAGRWLRTSVQPASLQLSLTVPHAGFYDLILNAMGDRITVRFNGHLTLSANGKPYLEELTLPPVYLPAGNNQLSIDLPPRSGLDRILLGSRQTNLTTLSEILQLAVTTEVPTPTDLDRLTARLATASR